MPDSFDPAKGWYNGDDQTDQGMKQRRKARTMAGGSAVRYVAVTGLLLLAVAVITAAVGCDPERVPRGPVPEIRNWHDLNRVRDYLGGSFILMNDLDATTAGYEEVASGAANDKKGWQPIGTSERRFTGSFDGQGYEITGLRINRPAESFVGLFGTVGKGGVVQNVGVDAIVSGEWSVGGLLGANWGTVSNCYSTGSVSGDDYVGGLLGGNADTVINSYSTASVIGRWDVGGLLGANDLAGTVIDCYATGSVSGEWSVGGLLGGNWGGLVSGCRSGGSVSGDDYVGGLVGDNQGDVRNAYATGSVTGEWHVGGLVGFNEGSVSNTYSTGDVTGSIWVGGLVGNSREGVVRHSFWDTESSGIGESDGGTGMTTTEMRTIAAFTDAEWDIAVVLPGQTEETSIWNIIDGETYPFLSWEAG